MDTAHPARPARTRTALFGGSFDPPHVGHQLAIAYVLGVARVDRLLVVPCFEHVFDKPLRPFEHRLAMARLMTRPFGAQVEVSDIERRLGGESRTLRTVEALAAERPGEQLAVVIGSDLLAERERWWRYDELAARVDFFVVGRAGHEFVDGNDGDRLPLPIPDVSSTEVRARLAHGDSVAGWVPAAVCDYITEHGLYRECA